MVAMVLCFGAIFAEEELRISSVQYWIDDNHTTATISSLTEFDLNCASLPTGVHTLRYRVVDNKGRYSSLHEHGFFKVQAENSATKIETLQYWWDDMRENAVSAPYTPDEFVLSTDALPYGLHSLKYRVKDDAGRWSDLRGHYFYRGETLDSARIVSYSYWWNDLSDEVTTKQLESPVATFVIDDDLTVPQSARTGYAGHYTATLNLCVTDNRGRVAFVTSNVQYPDNDAPVTDIDAAAYISPSTEGVEITWVENTNDMMADYNVYVSKDNGPFYLWRADTKESGCVFRGVAGSSYRFTVTGRDAFGNRESYDESKCVSVTFE